MRDALGSQQHGAFQLLQQKRITQPSQVDKQKKNDRDQRQNAN